MIKCTRCQGTGFLNIEQVPEAVVDKGTEAIREWLDNINAKIERLDCSCHLNPPCGRCELLHDVQVCDCCGDGEEWYGMPGEHYNREDPSGKNGPYASNGGLCRCH